jgi:hypothetical protein
MTGWNILRINQSTDSALELVETVPGNLTAAWLRCMEIAAADRSKSYTESQHDVEGYNSPEARAARAWEQARHNRCPVQAAWANL